jgi:hypothetical protein
VKVRKNKIKKIEYLYYKPNSLYVKVNGYTYKFTPIFQFQVREIEDLFARDPKAALKKLIGMKGAHFTVKGNPDMKKKNNPPGKVWAPYLRMLAATLTEDAATYNKYYRMVSGDRFISKKKAKEWLRRIGVGDEKVIETAQKMEHFKANPFDPDQKFWLKKRIKVLKHMARMEKRDPRKRKFYEGRAKEVAYMMKYYGNPKRKKKKARPKKKAKKVTRKATGIIQQLYGGPAWVSIIDLHSEPGWGIRAGEMAKLIKKEARVSAKSEHSPYVGFRAVAIRATSTNDIRKALKVLRRYHKITNVADHYRQIMGNITRGHLIV